MRGEPRQQGQGEIRGRPSRRHRHHAIARVAELPDIDRHGLGPAEHGFDPANRKQLGDQQKPRQQDGADHIHMADRVQAEPPSPGCRVIPQSTRSIAMRRFMQRDGDDGREDRSHQFGQPGGHGVLSLGVGLPG